MPKYRVKPGFTHGKDSEYGAGDVVELTEREATPLLDKLVKVDDTPAPKTISVSDKTVADLKDWIETGPDKKDVEIALGLEQADKQRTSVVALFTGYLGGDSDGE